MNHVSPSVLIVDDFTEYREIMAEVLEWAGYEVFTAPDAGYALFHLLGRDPVDVVLADIRMPGLSGLQLRDAIADRRPELAARFVFMTGSLLSGRDRAALDRWQAPLLFKPVSRSELVQSLADFRARRTPIPREHRGDQATSAAVLSSRGSS